MGAKKVSISLEEELLEAAYKRQKAFGYKKFSHYVDYCVRKELESGATEHVAVRAVKANHGFELNERNTEETPTPPKKPAQDKRRRIAKRDEN